LHDAAGFAPDAVPTAKAIAIRSAAKGNRMDLCTCLASYLRRRSAIMTSVTASYKPRFLEVGGSDTAAADEFRLEVGGARRVTEQIVNSAAVAPTNPERGRGQTDLG
jgi:hypothetical protein